MRKIISILISVLFLAGTAACTAKPGSETSKPDEPIEYENVNAELNENFCGDLIAFLNQNGFSEENYLVSPTSFRAALCLAIAGAEGQTREELLAAAGFRSVDEANAWYDGIRASVEWFRENLRLENKDAEAWLGEAGKADRAFSFVNSVWNNTDIQGNFLDTYKKYVAEHYDAVANSVSAAEITDAVNGWCDENTNGLIPVISDDLSENASVLVNALYLRTAWTRVFEEYFTKKDAFTCLDGSEVEKEFMEQTEDFAFYQDESKTLVVLPMKGNMYFVAVLGDCENLPEAIQNAEFEKVHVKLPKLEIESSFEHSELVRYLASRGVVKAFNKSAADFSAMSDFPWFIDDIIQKTKIKTDEDGIEAAAVTAIEVKATGFMEPDQSKPKEFIADHPFSFYIYSGLWNENTEMLFYGQCVK